MKKLFYMLVFSPFIAFSDPTVNSYIGFLMQNGFSYVAASGAVEDYDLIRLLSVDGKVIVRKWNVDLPRPTEDDLPSGAELEALISAGLAKKEQARQAAKPLEQKQYENKFFQLIEALYNETGVTNTVTPKIGFPEIEDLIETVQATDPMEAVNYSLKLLSIDAALKRYNALWWDDAIQHALP